MCGNCLVGLNYYCGSRGRGFGPVKHVSGPSNLLLIVLRRYFCYGSIVLHLMSVCIWSSAI